MAILETLEGDEPEILDRADTLENWSKSNREKHTTTTKKGYTMPRVAKRPIARQTMKPNASGGVWHHYGSSAHPRTAPSRYVHIGNNPEAESLEGWLTDIKKGASSAIRSVASVGMDITRSVAPVVGTVIGKAAAAAVGSPTAASGAGGGGIMDSLTSMFSSGSSAPSAAPAGAVQMPTQTSTQSGIGGIPPIYLAAGGALLLVLLLKK